MKRIRSLLGLLLALSMLLGSIPVSAATVRDASLDAALNGAGSSYTYTTRVCRGGDIDVVSYGSLQYAVLYAEEQEQGDYETYVQTTVAAEAGAVLSFKHAATLDYMGDIAEVHFGLINGSSFTELYSNEDENGFGEISGDQVIEWETFEYTFTAPGAYTLRWVLESSSLSSCYAIDDILLTPSMTLERAANAEGCDITWTNDADHPWEPYYYGGRFCMRSGRISHNETTSVTTSGIVLFAGDSFDALISSSCEDGCDMLDVYVCELSAEEPEWDHQGTFSGVSNPMWSNSFGWSAPHDGYYSFKFVYSKDNSVSNYDDCVYVAQVEHDTGDPIHAFAVAEEELFYLQPSGSDYTFVPIYSSDEFMLESNNQGVSSSDAVLNFNSYLTTGDGITFYYKVGCETNYDYFEVKVDGVTMLHETGSVGWEDFFYRADTSGIHEFSLTYHKDSSVNVEPDSVKLMQLRFVPDQLDIALREEGTYYRFDRGTGADLLELIDGEERFYARLTEEDSSATVSHTTYINAFEYITFDYRVTGDASLTFIAWDGIEKEFTDDYSDAWHTYYYRIPASDTGYFAWMFEVGSGGTVCLDNIHFGGLNVPFEEAINDPETDAYPTEYTSQNFIGRYDPKEPRGITKYVYACPEAGHTEALSWTVTAHAGDKYRMLFKFFDEDDQPNGSSFNLYQNGREINELTDTWMYEATGALQKWAVITVTFYEDEDVTFSVVYRSYAQKGGDGFAVSMLRHTIIGATLDEALNVEGGSIHFSEPGEGGFLPAREEGSDRIYGAPEFIDSEDELDIRYGFEADEDLSGWQLVDADGDSCTFIISDMPSGMEPWDGPGSLQSGKFFTSSADLFDTDNWAISPVFTVPKGSLNSFVDFYYIAVDGAHHPEEFEVYVLPEGDIDRAVLLYSDTADDEWDGVALSLYRYDGMEIAIAFRHYTPAGAYGLIIDGFHVGGDAPIYSELSFTQTLLPGDIITFDLRTVVTNSYAIENTVLMTVFEDDRDLYSFDTASFHAYHGEDWETQYLWYATPGTHTYRIVMSVNEPNTVYNSCFELDEVQVYCTILPGDVNGSSSLELGDASDLVSYLLNMRELSEYSLNRADANRDGSIDILDVSAICEKVLNR